MRTMIILTSLAIGMTLAPPAPAQVSIGVNLPGLSIGVNLPVYPNFVPVPGYPVYYAPQVDTNLFFYDGLYWAYSDDNWYASSWYNGPWDLVEPSLVPYFVLRVPILYYRRPPAYFGRWDRRQAPRWGEHWGSGWQQQHRDWDRWDRARPPARAPLPIYQRQYSRDRYPNANEQRILRERNYRFQPKESVDRRLLVAPPGQQRTQQMDQQRQQMQQRMRQQPARQPAQQRTQQMDRQRQQMQQRMQQPPMQQQQRQQNQQQFQRAQQERRQPAQAPKRQEQKA
ncbi:MAG: hypothetical protein HIU85_17325, partial [Proteobacteria bacterium]|nr:hypothetical protein [Pseudomonadota bacterium]